ncbi:MAG: glycosyltransferase [Verrucomicrobiota bacterium]
MTRRPLLSALVSVYDAEDWIEGCLEDLVQQSLFQLRDMEVIVIDADSPSNERVVIAEFQRRFPKNIIYHRLSSKESLYGAWNQGIELAAGRYLTSANCDDRHHPDGLKRLVDELEKNPQLGLVFADQLVTRKPHESFAENSATERWNWPEYDPAILRRRCVIGPQPVWRWSLHREYGLFDPTFRSAGDWEFWLRISPFVAMKKVGEILGLYYLNPKGLEHSSKGTSSELPEEVARIREKYDLHDEPLEATELGPLADGFAGNTK